MFSTLLPDGFEISEHTLEVPWDRENPSLGTLEVFARELYTDPAAPALAYFQGGPGNPGPRMMMGWIPEALQHYRVLLIDERGTGRSTRVDRRTEEFIDAAHLSHLRPPDIAADAEALRLHLGLDTWDLLGNSFGGICVASYLSYFPEHIGRAMLTGSVPPFGVTPDEYNTAMFELLAQRVERFYAAVPWAEARVREVCHHLDTNEETLPSGERLTAERFRFVGVALGEEGGFDKLATLLEAPFYTAGGVRRLRTDFLVGVQSAVSVEANPMWAVVHEQIFGGLPGGPVRWSAARVAEQVDGFSLDADPRSAEKFYPLGNAFFPFHFEQDPALRPFYEPVSQLAEKDDWRPSVDADRLRRNAVPTAALLYRDDMFIPFDFATARAAEIPNLVVTTHPTYQHDGMYLHGGELFRQVFDALPR